MNSEYYENKSINYGMGHTRLRRILSFLKNTSNLKILDVGCASGYLGKHLKDRGAYVVGSDISSGAIKKAAKIIDEAYLINPGEILPENAKTKFFDVVVISEVLEHVFSPAEMLKKIGIFLKPEGFVIVTTPNFLTWTNRLRFLFGKFKYSEQGMFDFGHIRWFTWSYLKEVVNDSGYEIIENKSIIFPGKLTKILRLYPSLFAWQFIIKIRKKK